MYHDKDRQHENEALKISVFSLRKSFIQLLSMKVGLALRFMMGGVSKVEII